MEESDQVRKWENERLELIRASGSGGALLFWMAGAAFAACILEALGSGPSSMSGFGFATSFGLLIWAIIERDKKETADRKIRQIDGYLQAIRNARR